MSSEVDVRAFRACLNLSQEASAQQFGFNPSAVREWEQKRRHPDRSARIVLRVIAHKPEVVIEALSGAA